MNEQEFLDAINQTMPFGKYKGRKLIDLPEPYLVWFHGQGFPKNKLGAQLALIYEIKLAAITPGDLAAYTPSMEINGLEGMAKKV